MREARVKDENGHIHIGYCYSHSRGRPIAHVTRLLPKVQEKDMVDLSRLLCILVGLPTRTVCYSTRSCRVPLAWLQVETLLGNARMTLQGRQIVVR